MIHRIFIRISIFSPKPADWFKSIRSLLGPVWHTSRAMRLSWPGRARRQGQAAADVGRSNRIGTDGRGCMGAFVSFGRRLSVLLFSSKSQEIHTTTTRNAFSAPTTHPSAPYHPVVSAAPAVCPLNPDNARDSASGPLYVVARGGRGPLLL